MEIREYKTYNESEILRLYTSVGWTAYTDQPEVLRKGFESSMLTLAAYEGDQLLGIIRTVGDEPIQPCSPDSVGNRQHAENHCFLQVDGVL